MGHVRLGTLPKTRAWKDVIALIADGADPETIAAATMKAADKAFESIQWDDGYAETVDLLTQLAVAARSDDPRSHLESVGINIPDQASLPDVALAISKALESSVSDSARKSDFPELAHNALVGAVVEHLNDKFGGLFPPSADDIHQGLAELGKKNEFGKLARTFYGKLTNESLEWFLSRTVGTQIGEGQRFATTNQVAQFQQALVMHCHEASEIVERFSADWFSKNHFQGKGDISTDRTKGFGAYAMQKMRDELKMRAVPNES
jgi:hypothetical protein